MKIQPFVQKFFLPLILLLIATFAYFFRYGMPNGPYWDENYHIASAEKYIEGTYFMEVHPPLGKLFIALGEVITGSNRSIDKQSFTETDYIKEFPPGFDFKGVRLFPTIFAVLSVLVFFYLIFIISKNQIISFCFALLYLFDNALMIHFRGAMLDSIQIFFVLSALAFFVKLLARKPKNLDYLILGGLIGLAASVKITGAFLVLLFPFLYWHYDKFIIKSFLAKGISFIIGGVFVFAGVFYLHAVIGARPAGGNYYNASEKYKEVLAKGQTANPLYLPMIIKDNLAYSSDYNSKVPALNLCSPTENGSLPIGWPLGIKSIDYRWEKHIDSSVSYAYLQINPMAWGLALFGLILSIALFLVYFIFKIKVLTKDKFFILSALLTLYIGYMVAVLRIPRVMYLYHYFVPFSLTLIMSAILSSHFVEKNKKLIYWLVVITLVSILTFLFFSPFTYFTPLHYNAFQMRNWWSAWKLSPVD